MREYVKCKYNLSDSKSYIFHNDGDPVFKGEVVEITGMYDIKFVTVIEVSNDKPSFETKAISKVDTLS